MRVPEMNYTKYLKISPQQCWTIIKLFIAGKIEKNKLFIFVIKKMFTMVKWCP